ncbi:MAG TPA: cupin domain-containing protein [Chroococcales cyanobacterium]|jgi:predicted cupin superfamily sugar epimerase
MKEILIEKLGLLPHPEGGAFRETYRMKERVALDGKPIPGAFAWGGTRSLFEATGFEVVGKQRVRKSL